MSTGRAAKPQEVDFGNLRFASFRAAVPHTSALIGSPRGPLFEKLLKDHTLHLIEEEGLSL
jgi:hypothetical protein